MGDKAEVLGVVAPTASENDVGEENKVLKALEARAQAAQQKLDLERAAQEKYIVSKEEARAWFKDKLQSISDMLSDELCSAIAVGRHYIEIGTWYRPYLLEEQKLKPSFTPPEFRQPSCLVILFAKATADGMIEVLKSVLEDFLKEIYKGHVSLTIKDLSKTPPEIVRAPRTHQFALKVNYKPAS